MDKYRIIIYKILLLGIGFGLSLVILEVSAKKILEIRKLEEKVRYAENKIKDNDNPRFGSSDMDLGWSFQPNTKGEKHTSDFDVEYSINSKGVRDKEISIDKPPGEFRIVAMGESTVFGEGVNYGRRFTEVIEDSLEDVEVINMGIWGFGVDQSLLQLERDSFQFHPDLVILFVAFDFFNRSKSVRCISDGCLKPRFILNQDKNGIESQDMEFVISKFKPPSSIIRKAEIEIPNDKIKFLRKSNFFTLLHDIIRMRKIKQINQRPDVYKQINSAIKNDKSLADIDNDEDFKKLIYFILQKYRALCQTHGADFMLVYINPDFNNDRYLNAVCQDLKIYILNLSGVLSYASKIRPLKFNIDGHYNDFTHKVIGEYTSGHLQEKYNLKKNKNYTYEFMGKWKVGLE